MRITLSTATAVLILTTSMAQAGPISRACMDAGKTRNNSVCGCIQQVANATLTSSDQRLAAKIFRKPQMAQDIRMSDSSSHEVFWKRYKVFGATASKTCS